MTAEDSIDLLSRALGQVSTLIAGTTSEQRSWPTPCAGWDVSALADHLYGDISRFIVAARGDQPDWSSTDGHIEGDWTTEFSAAARTLLDTWRAADLSAPVPGVGGGEMPLYRRADMQITELAIHAWDLDRATRQSVDLDPAVAGRALEFGRGMLRPEFRGPEGSGKAFGLEVSVGEDASIEDRLAGWFGRRPDWRPVP